jgi:D-alanine--poly(phosphoribitol) ligase subunit 1
MSDVLHTIIDHAQITPDQSAVKDLQADLTYARLIDEVARLAAGLTAKGVAEGDRVALLIPNSVDFVVAALASLWIGAIFVPLAVTDPEARLDGIVRDCAPRMVIVRDDDAITSPVPFASLGGVTLTPIAELRASATVGAAPLDERSRPAYAIFTSGTTGTPKGVLIGTAAFAAAVSAAGTALGLDRATRTLCVSPFHFDGSYATLFPTLTSGGQAVIRPRDALLFPRTFFNALKAEGITFSGFTPSYLRLLLSSPQISTIGDTTLDTIALGGEACSASELRSLWSWAPQLRVFNRYGPTETTLAVTNEELTIDIIADGTVPIGFPHPNVSFFLLDEDGAVIDGPDQVGELYIGGNQLMDGYWGDEALTRSVLRTDVVAGHTLYRSGDLVFRNGDGRYVYVDRADRVLKRSGVRISLVELGAVMQGLDGVTSAACATFDNDGELGIVAFVVVNRALTPLDLWRAARTYLADNMLPDRIELVDSLALNKSNKLDERSLLSGAGLRPVPLASAIETTPKA